MTALLVLLGIALFILLFLYILQRHEIRNIYIQLKSIRSKDTNELVHSTNVGNSSNELIKEINEKLKEVRQSRIDYSRKSHALEQMMTNISHDLRTPLTSAMCYIDLIRNSDMSEEEKSREIMIVEQRLMRLEELINSFFEFSKIISGDKQPDLEELNLTAVLEEAIVHYYDDFSGQNREVVLECNTRKINIRSNRNMLMRIFENLISNAYKHGTGNLAISVDNANDIKISFKNSLYDSEVDIDRIFDEFYTTDISRTKGNTGLGLAIAKQFTLMLNGSISAKYIDNCFSVTITLRALEDTE